MNLALRLTLVSAISFALFANAVSAQDAVIDPDTKALGSTSRTTIVRAGSSLFSLSAKLDGSLLLTESTDDGATWKDTGFTFNDASSGIGTGTLTNYCALAVDSRGWLHATWRRAAYPSNYYQYYRNVNPANWSQGSNILDVQANIAKQSTTTRSAAMGVAIDSKGYVWMLATGSQWMSQLLRSDQPFAPGATPGFTSVGNLSQAGSASQNPRLAVDANDVVQCIFHYASGTRSVAHNSYDPATQTWSGVVRLGSTTNNSGMIACDRTGVTHALYGTSGTQNTLEYRSYTAANGWSSPITVTSFSSAQLGTSNGQWYYTIACHPITGVAYAIFRDFGSAGEFVIQSKAPSDPAFAHVATIAPASTAKNTYFLPNVRGSLNPFPTNGAICEIDIVYQDRSATKLRQVFVGLDVCSVATGGSSCAGSNGNPELSYGELPRLGHLFSVDLSNAVASGASICFLAFSDSMWGPVPLPLPLSGFGLTGCSLQVSLDIGTVVPTDAMGEGALQFTLPADPALAGLQLFNQYLVVDPTANTAGLVTSNSGGFTIRP
jgi:hypothetical protein